MLRYDIVDVFSDRPFAGNQLAVVHDAAGLSTEQCLALAREFHLSETVFPVPRSGADYDVRIFTPGGEIPFAGHPTLGSAWILRDQGHLDADQVVQHCGAGDIGVSFDGPMVELSASARDRLAPVPEDLTERLLDDIGLSAVDLVDLPVLIVGTGLNFVHIPVHASAVRRAVPTSQMFRRYDYEFSLLGYAQDPIEGINLYSFEHGEDRVDVRSRVFMPGLSIPEDPATGSAASGLGIALQQNGVIREGDRYRILQGVEMGRPSVLHGRLADGLVHVAGQVQHVATGQIRVPEPA